MKVSKRFVQIFFSFLLLFVVVNAIIWYGWTEVILSPRYEGGDLTRLGFISGIKKIRNTVTNLPLQHIEMYNYAGGPVDMITIGDSFSIGGGDGENRYYQDYIATIDRLKVLNIPTYRFNRMVCGAMPVATLAVLYHSGMLDRIKPKYVLIETVERYAIPRLVTNFNFNRRVNSADLDNYYRMARFDGVINKNITFINEGNFKFLYYTLMYNFSEHAFRKLVIKTKLSHPFFSGDSGDVLLFHVDDIQQNHLSTKANIIKANDNLNYIAKLLKKRGITLIFMPVVDKMNLYRPYFLNNSYPYSMFFEEFRKLPKNYVFIDTKEILGNAVNRGELDIFHQDDTHWTCKASELIFNSVKFSGALNPQ